jgi:hypothetical protein
MGYKLDQTELLAHEPSRLSTECEYSSDSSPSRPFSSREGEAVGERDVQDGVRAGRLNPRPLTLAADAVLDPKPEWLPFGDGLGLERKPTRPIARRSISPEESRAIKNRASSPQSSQSPF